MKPRLLIYCQHSLGLGHFTRSLILAEAMAGQFDVIFFNGGPVPVAAQLPPDIRFEHLPPLRMEEDGALSGAGQVDMLLRQRRAHMLAVAGEAPVAALLVELYPFGRKKFAVEIDPLVSAVHAQGGKIVCSVRDLLVTGRIDQAKHDQRAADKLNADFDAVLVHSDQRVFCLEDSFRPAEPLRLAVNHTGFVSRAPAQEQYQDGNITLVTAGGGVVGRGLYEAAIAAQPILWKEKGWPMTIVAGPLLPDADWEAISVKGKNIEGLQIIRAVPSLAHILCQAGRVVSQCGYNSALEILQTRLPVLFVPFSREKETEQTARAQQLKELGLAQWAPESGLDGTKLAQLLLALNPPVKGEQLKLDGAQRSAEFLVEMIA